MSLMSLLMHLCCMIVKKFLLTPNLFDFWSSSSFSRVLVHMKVILLLLTQQDPWIVWIVSLDMRTWDRLLLQH